MTKTFVNDEKILRNASGFSMSLETLKQYEGDYTAMLPEFLAKYEILKIQTQVKLLPTASGKDLDSFSDLTRLHETVQDWEKGLEDIVRSLEEDGVSGACIKTVITVKKEEDTKVLPDCIQKKIRVLETREAFLQGSSCGAAESIRDEIKELTKGFKI